MMANQYPSAQDFYDAEKDLKTLDAVSNSVHPDTGQVIDTYETRSGGTTKTIRGVIKDLGFKPATFDFITGGTLNSGDYDLCVYNPSPNGDNLWYSWGGALPKVISPNSTPQSTGGFGPDKWTDRTDTKLREDLADVNSGVLIAGIPASEVASFRAELAELDSEESVSGVKAKDLALLSKGDDYTYISSSAARIDKLTKTLTQNLTSIVITGDSLSFNAFGYPAGFSTNGADYATNNPFGLSSWAHLLRDALFTSHESFQPVEFCKLETDATMTFPEVANGTAQHIGINIKAIFLTFSSQSRVARLSSAYTGSKALIVSYQPSAEAVLFEVNGVEYNTTSPNGHYKSFGYLLIPFSGDTASISKVRRVVGGGQGTLLVYGCGSTNMTIAKLTGKGAWTSGQILAEYSTLVAPYSPDIIYYIIGANDISTGVPVATMDSNIRQFITNARAAKPNCEIVLLSTPPTSSYTRAAAKPYIKAMRTIAEDTNSSLVDMWSALEKIPSSEYRYDNIHFNTQGDTLVFDIVRKLTLPNYEPGRDQFHACRESFLGSRGSFLYYKNNENLNLPLVLTIRCVAGAPTITVTGPSKRVSTFTGAYTTINGLSGLRITGPEGSMINGVTPLTLTFGAAFKQVQLSSITNERTWDFIGIDNSHNQISLDGSGLYFILNATLMATY